MLTERAYLHSIGLTASPTGRGRFSADAHKALARAIDLGQVFQSTKPVSISVKPKAAPKPAPAKTEAPKVDAAKVRVWAGTKGITVGQRGRIHPDVVAQYLADPGTDKAAPQPAPLVGKDTRPAAPHRYPEGTTFTAKFKDSRGIEHTQTLGLATCCHYCRVSLIGHVCDTPAVTTGYGIDPVRVTVNLPKG